MHKVLKNPRLLVVCVGLIAAVVLVVISQEKPAAGKCGVYRNDKTVVLGGSTKLKTERVQTQSDLAKGLSGRPCIEVDRAMLFEFSKPDHYSIWMKNMKFPIDVFWISSDHKVVAIEKVVKPDTYPDRFINKEKPALYVLETKAGLADAQKIGLGASANW